LWTAAQNVIVLAMHVAPLVFDCKNAFSPKESPS